MGNLQHHPSSLSFGNLERKLRRQPFFLLFLLLTVTPLHGLNQHHPSPSHQMIVSRRNALVSASAAAASVLLVPTSARGITIAVDDGGTGDDLAMSSSSRHHLSNGLSMPKVGYSFYKTTQKVETCAALALAAGVRQFDCASQYENNAAVGAALREYMQTTTSSGSGSGGDETSPQSRRKELFVTHKVSNEEQAVDTKKVQRAVRQEMKNLSVQYLDLCMIHSPLTSRERRLGTYTALLEMHRKGLIQSVGVCHYSVEALNEIVDAGLPPPHVVQLQLSPFHQHKDVVTWAKAHDSTLSCSTWSKLSSLNGPVDGWAVLADMAMRKSVTKAQLLVAWALRMGYLSVPRSSANSKLERLAIVENSYDVCSQIALSDEDLSVLNRLDVQLPAGQLEVTDGYTIDDIKGQDWDPTKAPLL